MSLVTKRLPALQLDRSSSTSTPQARSRSWTSTTRLLVLLRSRSATLLAFQRKLPRMERPIVSAVQMRRSVNVLQRSVCAATVQRALSRQRQEPTTRQSASAEVNSSHVPARKVNALVVRAQRLPSTRLRARRLHAVADLRSQTARARLASVPARIAQSKRDTQKRLKGFMRGVGRCLFLCVFL